MNMATIIAVIALAAVLSGAITYIVKEKKKGNKCIGCPFADSCQKYHQGNQCNSETIFFTNDRENA